MKRTLFLIAVLAVPVPGPAAGAETVEAGLRLGRVEIDLAQDAGSAEVRLDQAELWFGEDLGDGLAGYARLGLVQGALRGGPAAAGLDPAGGRLGLGMGGRYPVAGGWSAWWAAEYGYVSLRDSGSGDSVDLRWHEFIGRAGVEVRWRDLGLRAGARAQWLDGDETGRNGDQAFTTTLAAERSTGFELGLDYYPRRTRWLGLELSTGGRRSLLIRFGGRF